MAEDIQSIPASGPGSQTPGQIPSLHTPVGSGADATGVNGIGKSKGLPGAPLGGGGGLPSLGGGAPGLGANVPATPEQQLMERSENRLKTDLEDIFVGYKDDLPENKKVAKTINNVNQDNLDEIITLLVDKFGWQVDRLKQLIPSRDEKEIIEYLNDLKNSNTQKDVDVNQQENTPMPPLGQEGEIPLPVAAGLNSLKNIKKGASMNKQADLIIKDGTMEQVVADKSVLFDKVALSISNVKKARVEAKKAFLRKKGFDMMADLAKDDLGGMPEGEDPTLTGPTDPFGEEDLGNFSEGFGGDPKMEFDSKISELKDLMSELTELVKQISDGSSDTSADDMIKSDTLVDKAEDELEGAEKDIDTFDKVEEKDKASKEKDDKSENNDTDDSFVKEASTKKAMNVVPKPPKEGVDVNPKMNEANMSKETKASAEGGDPMTAATGKSAVLEDIKARLAALREAKEGAGMEKKAQLYPFKDQETPVDEINNQQAGENASAINSDLKGGFPASKESANLAIKPGEQVNDPGMEISKPYNKVAAAADALARKASVEATAKTRVAMEIASMQQLKGVPGMENPLKEELVARFAEAGIDKHVAAAIVHNAYLDKYEDSQKVVIAAAFDVLANQSDDELVKVASFTKEFRTASANEETPEEGASDINQVTANNESGKTVTANLRGSQVSSIKDSSQVYKDFWRRSYAESKGMNV